MKDVITPIKKIVRGVDKVLLIMNGAQINNILKRAIWINSWARLSTNTDVETV